jgi:CDP-diacylglycerol---serine O-phosphatidyltransferase
MLKLFLTPPNWFTAANLFCGFYAVVILLDGGSDPHVTYRAGLLVLFGAVFDMLDGRVARMTKTAGKFGIQLDSLADIVSFGVAPALLAYVWGVDRLGVVGLASVFFFLVCGAFRLARFNVKAETKAANHSEGITITVAGIFLSLVIMAHAATGRDAPERPLSAALLMVVLSFLMVSRVPYRTFKTVRASPRFILGLALIAGLGVALGVRYDISTVAMIAGAIYVASGPVEGLVGIGLRRGHRTKKPKIAAEEKAPVSKSRRSGDPPHDD